MTTPADFSKWLQDQLTARDWRQVDLVHRSKLNSGLISRIFNGEILPGYEAARAIAKAFSMKDTDVLRIAGMLDPAREDEINPSAGEMLGLFNTLSEADQEEMLQIARLKVERLRKQGRPGAHARFRP